MESPPNLYRPGACEATGEKLTKQTNADKLHALGESLKPKVAQRIDPLIRWQRLALAFVSEWRAL